MYSDQAHAGSTPDFWEENWDASVFEESVRFCPIDPLRPLFEKYSQAGSLMLEGGCGLGHYLAYYAARGRRVIGLDFAQRALQNLHKRQSYLDLCAGDVSRLPFADETFDLYYSGGVVEHFESGADESLREARRVMKQDATLLISVPYYSPLRQLMSPFKRSEWRPVDNSQIDIGQDRVDKKFFQYAYTRSEFATILARAGLRVVKTQGYAVVWGLQEIPLLNRPWRSEFRPNKSENASKESGVVNIDSLIREPKVSLIKRLVVSEDASVPVLGLGVTFLRWAAANMMMYVCVRD